MAQTKFSTFLNLYEGFMIRKFIAESLQFNQVALINNDISILIFIFNSVCNFSEFFELQQPFGLESGLLLIQQKTCFSKNI